MLPTLYTADLHVHTRKKEPSRIDELTALIKKLNTLRINFGYKQLVIAGDLSDGGSSLSIASVLLLGKLFKKFDKVYLLEGNHDTPVRNTGYSLLSIFNLLECVEVIDSPRVSGGMAFLPYYAKLSDLEVGTADILVMHKDIKELNQYYEEEFALSLDDLPPMKYIFNGHLHSSRVLSNNTGKFIQLGAPYPCTWSDSDEKNRFVFGLHEGKLKRLKTNITKDNMSKLEDKCLFIRERDDSVQLKEEAALTQDKLTDLVHLDIYQLIDALDTDRLIKQITKRVVYHASNQSVTNEQL